MCGNKQNTEIVTTFLLLHVFREALGNRIWQNQLFEVPVGQNYVSSADSLI